MFDLAAIRNKLKGLEEGKPKSKKWKPKDEHTVRVLPLPGEEDLSFVVKWHYGVDNGRQMACPGTWGDDCAFCELGKRLKSWKDEKGRDKSEEVRKADWNFFKKIDAAVKHYVPVVVRKKDSTDIEGPFLWECTPKTYQALLKICANDDWNEEHPEGGALRVLTSLMHGLDLVVRLKKANTDGNKTSYDLTEVEERKKFSAIFKGDKPAAEALLAKIPTASEIATQVTTEDSERVFAAWRLAMETAPADHSEPSGDGVEYSSNSSETVASGGASVDETVAKLEKMLGGK
jgi:hypothetical protein